MFAQRRAVISGFGIVSPLGMDGDSLWNALCQRKSGWSWRHASAKIQATTEGPCLRLRKRIEARDVDICKMRVAWLAGVWVGPVCDAGDDYPVRGQRR